MREGMVKLTAVFTEKEAAAIREACHKDRRTVSNFIRKAVMDKLEVLKCSGKSNGTTN